MSPPPPTAHLKKGFALQLRTFSNLCLRQIAVAATSPLQGKGHLFYNFGYSLTALCAAAAAIRRRYFGCCTFLCISVSSLSLSLSLTYSFGLLQPAPGASCINPRAFSALSGTLTLFLSFLPSSTSMKLFMMVQLTLYNWAQTREGDGGEVVVVGCEGFRR